jgi:hypothetical protein
MTRTPASKPTAAPRRPSPPEPGGLPAVVTAVHQASETLIQIAAAADFLRSAWLPVWLPGAGARTYVLFCDRR